MSETELDINNSSSRHYEYKSSFVGDTPYTNFIRSYEDSYPLSDSIEYKLPYTHTMESQIRKLRLSVETYRELLLNIYSILLWERQWHPTSLAAGCTVIFMLIWLSESNLLTIISLLGMVITIGDYTLPALVSTLYKHDTWNTQKQARYEELCTNVILYKTKFELLVSAYYRMRETNPKMYFTLTIVGLSILTWIGGRVNNLFLAYLLVVIVLLLPGMSHHGFLNKVTEQSSKLFTDLVENAKAKVGQKKID